MKIEIRNTYRCSNLIGMPVKNARGEDIGKIEELVVDLNQNRLIYAALSFGGFLGVGAKVFAIPWEALSLKFDERSTYFLLDANPEELRAAPGFGREHWPDTTDPNWAEEIDAYYRGEKKQPAPQERLAPEGAQAEPAAAREPEPPRHSRTDTGVVAKPWKEEDLADTIAPVAPGPRDGDGPLSKTEREPALPSVR